MFLTNPAIFGAGAEASEVTLSSLFWKRSWAAMDEVYLSKKELSAQEHSLMANALRIQEKWGGAVDILEKHRSSFQAEVRPYANMTLLLGYEKLGRYPDALKLASEMEKNAPEGLRYYIAYAQYRMLANQVNQNADGAKNALEKMLRAADTKDRKITALSRLIKLPGDQRANAVALLEEQPANKEAYDVLAASPKPWSPAINLAMGEYAYRKNDYKTAISLLSAVPQGSGWRKAAYYRAFALERTNNHAEALNIFGNLAMSGNSYAESSVRRIATIAGRAEKANAIAALRKIVNGRKGKVQARAMFSLAGLVGGDEAKKIEDGLIQAYPDSINTVKVLWKRGWDAWNANKLAEAAEYWKRICAPGIDAVWEARVLYWIGAAQMSMNQTGEADKTYSTLVRRHPLSYYTFMARPGAIKLHDGVPSGLASNLTLLENWGFVLYAKLNMQRPKASGKELFRSMELSDWLGEEGGTYAQARALSRYFVSGANVYRKGLEYLYPRPFRRQVDAAAAEFGVENNLVWSVMRQESAFAPRATSHAGASGLMQLMPATAKDEANRVGLKSYDIYNVTDNIRMGTSHLAWLARSFSRLDWIMAAYNAGSGNARKWMADGGSDLTSDFWIERIRFDETCDYVQRVSGNLEVYRMLYGAAAPVNEGKNQ
ncbi:MAG: transglycosylase SLT domain-containing protein [Synergistaceae bacterium]|nr:transglycosylase SLT domain-containing protein [Synergistaceae bacterium]